MNTLLDKNTIGFLVDSRSQTGELSQLGELLNAPKDFAKRYSIPISKPVERKLLELGEINKAKGYKPDDPTNKEIMSFFNRVLIDGRFIEEWATNPSNAAKQIDAKVSPEAIRRIEELNFNDLVDTKLLIDPKRVNQEAIGVVIVIVLVVIFVLIPSSASLAIQEVIVDPRAQGKV